MAIGLASLRRPEVAASGSPTANGRSRVTIVAPGDRTSAFKVARRHTLVVRLLKFALPLATVGALSSYWLGGGLSFSVNVGPVTAPKVQLSTENLTMERPRYEGFGRDGSRHVVTAAKAIQDLRQQGPIKLEVIDGTLLQPGKGTITLKSARGTFDSKANILELMERVEIDGDNGLKARLTQATLLLKEHKITSREPVAIEMAAGRVRGNEMVLLQDKRHVTFTGGVETELRPPNKPDAGAAQPKRIAASGLGPRPIGGGDGPIAVASSRLFVDDTRKTAIFTGNVTAKQGGASLAASELEAHYEGQPVDLGPAKATPGATPSPVGDAASGKLKRLIARENVVMVQGDDRVTSSVGEFDAVAETAVLTGGVVMTSAPDRRAVGDRVELDQKADTVLIAGNVEVTQATNLLRGGRLALDRKLGKLKLTSPAEDGRPAGRIFTRFVQPDAAAGGKAKAPAKREPETGGTAGGFSFKADPSQPTEIEAASLDADDGVKTAIYRGQVRAKQGDNLIQTEELIAYYTGSASAGLAAAPATGANPAPKQKTELTRVVSKSRLTVTSGSDQSASGDQGDFDLKSNRITVVGNVTLRQGKNVTHGPKAVIDLTTGQYQLEGNAPSAWRTVPHTQSPSSVLPDLGVEQATPSPRVTDPERQCPPGRSCAVFHPNDAKALDAKARKPGGASETQGGQPAKPRVPGAATTSSWDAKTTTPAR
jgi:LPS export ABC transporter protein LptC/lipopolysaccharide transport protein LptA